MSDPTDPKGSPAAPTESPTRAFALKMDGWMTDLMKKDLDGDPGSPDATATDLAAGLAGSASEPAEGAPAAEPTTPPHGKG